MSIYNLTLKELEDFMLSNGENKYRALQVFLWLYEKRVLSFQEMTNLSKDLIKKLEDTFTINRLNIIKTEHDVDVNKY